MAWLNPATTPPPEYGEFLVKFRSNGRDRLYVLSRRASANGKPIGVAGGLFEFDLGEMIGWHPLPEGLD